MISVAEVVEEEMGHDVGFVRLRDMFGCFFIALSFLGVVLRGVYGTGGYHKDQIIYG